MADTQSFNFSCLNAVITAYHTCLDDVTTMTTPSLSWFYPITFVGFFSALLLVMVICCAIGAILFSSSKSSFRHEFKETIEVIVCLFTAHLSFAALVINSVWLVGQVLASVCDMLSLIPH